MDWLSLASANAQDDPLAADVGGDDRYRDAHEGIQLQPQEAIFSSSDTGSVNGSGMAISGLPDEGTTKSLITSQIRAHFLPVEGGLLNLLKECLLAEDSSKVTVAVLCGHVDHFESANDCDLGWDCGWRNIQMLSSFLIASDAEAAEILFGGAKFVPDITALQRWMEIAWSEGFDEPGAEYFDWHVSGTMKWIGTTECATLLRRFGIVSKIVSFSSVRSKDDDELRLTAGSSALPLIDDQSECLTPQGDHDHNHNHNHNHNHINNVNDDPSSDKNVVDIQGVPQEEVEEVGLRRGPTRKSETRAEAKNDGSEKEGEEDLETHSRKIEQLLRHVSLGSGGADGSAQLSRPEAMRQRQITRKVLCYKRMNEAHKHSSGGTDSPEDYIFIEESPSIRTPRDWEEDREKSGQYIHEEAKQKAKPVNGKYKDTGHESTYFRMGTFHDISEGGSRKPMRTVSQIDEEIGDYKKIFDEEIGDYKKIFEKEVMVDEDEFYPRLFPKVFGEKAGTMRLSDSQQHHFKHNHLVAWVWRYFAQGPAEREIVSSQHSVNLSKRSPIYFQHEGHSRTIIGIERLRCPAGRSEEVFFLILDPSYVMISHPEHLFKNFLNDMLWLKSKERIFTFPWASNAANAVHNLAKLVSV